MFSLNDVRCHCCVLAYICYLPLLKIVIICSKKSLILKETLRPSVCTLPECEDHSSITHFKLLFPFFPTVRVFSIFNKWQLRIVSDVEV